MSEQTKSQPCCVCGESAIPAITLKLSEWVDRNEQVKYFNCVNCFWIYMDNVMASMNSGGRLDARVDWSGKSRKRIPGP